LGSVATAECGIKCIHSATITFGATGTFGAGVSGIGTLVTEYGTFGATGTFGAGVSGIGTLVTHSNFQGHWLRHLHVRPHWGVIVSVRWRHHAGVSHCTVSWRWLTSFSWARSGITWDYNWLTSAIKRQWVTRLTRRSHHLISSVMRSATRICHALAHVHHCIHDSVWYGLAFRHHHSSSVLHYGAHFRPTCIGRAHYHGRSNCCTDQIARSLKQFWRDAHFLKHWAHSITHGIKRIAHTTTALHGSCKCIHPRPHCFTKCPWISLNSIYYFLWHLWH
jgi:hypothetical protein